MVYEDYKKAALKHLRTCEFLKDNLSSVTVADKKDAILRNIYYLSGYILEGVINYGIYKTFYATSPNEKIDPFFQTIPASSGRGQRICFNYPNPSQKKKDSSLEGEWHYRIAGHKYMKNVEVIKDKLIAIHNRREFLYSNVFLCSVPSSALEKMFFKWSVDVRYETNTSSTPSAVNYNEVDVLAFFELAKEAYRVLPSRL